MTDLNKLLLIGRLGADPESRTTPTGTAVCNFRLATTTKWGEQEHTEWHRVVCFKKLAELAQKFLKKGRQIYLEGSVQTRKWEDKEGQERYTTEVIAWNIIFLGGQDQEQRNDSPPRQASRHTSQQTKSTTKDDYPF